MRSATLTRRHMMVLMGAVSAAVWAPPVLAAGGAARLIVLSDLHSAYERFGQLLAAIEAEISGNDVPHAILINGDVFELGNAVATRSGGKVDWAFLEALSSRAPVILNIGNHEPDFENDLAKVIARAQEGDITVVSNIIDKRTGEAYAPAVAEVALGAITLTVIGIATNAINTYPKPTREQMDIPDPVVWAEENLNSLITPGTLPVVLSHAGVMADRAILPGLPDGSLLIGGHDHLLLTHEDGGKRYVHTGSWSSVYTVVDIGADMGLAVSQRTVDAAAAPDAELAALIEATLAEHLTDEERAIIGTTQVAMSLSESARYVAGVMAGLVEADVGFIGHTTFGTGFPSGEVSKYAFDAVVRFDGKLMTAEVSAEVLAEMLAIANQDGEAPLEKRTGDFVYSNPVAPPQKETYRIVTNDWSAVNQKTYFGREDLEFTEVPDLRIKAEVIKSLS